MLIKELEMRKEEFNGQSIETIYFGGGTPSLLTVEELGILMDTVYQYYNVVENPEITLEANPDDLSNNKIVQLSRTSINRLSIGIQSFFDDDLKGMNRAHNAQEAKNCLKETSRYFDNISIDLIYGIPNMSMDKWDENLETAFNFNVKHISSYALTVEPKTALDTFVKKGSYPPIDDTLALQHFEHLIDKTNEQGFVQYEISNFGKPNYFSKHNTSYWQGKPYLGIGPSAHSYNNKERSWNMANNSKYIESIKNNRLPSTVESLTADDQYNEYIMTGLRTAWGISLDVIKNEFGESYLQYLKTSASKFIDQGLLAVTSNSTEESKTVEKLIATQKGKFLVDGIASELFKV